MTTIKQENPNFKVTRTARFMGGPNFPFPFIVFTYYKKRNPTKL